MTAMGFRFGNVISLLNILLYRERLFSVFNIPVSFSLRPTLPMLVIKSGFY
jgi:hypothetical protein